MQWFWLYFPSATAAEMQSISAITGLALTQFFAHKPRPLTRSSPTQSVGQPLVTVADDPLPSLDLQSDDWINTNLV